MPRAPSRFRVGARVADTAGATGVEPFTTLVVVDTHKDGTVDLAVDHPGGHLFRRVPTKGLTVLAPTKEKRTR